jgi:regulatory protein
LSTPTPSLKARALRHLARREHTRAELERKLGSALRAATADAAERTAERAADEGDAAVQIRRTLDELAARGLLSDERAAESLLAAQARRFGHRRLKDNLLAKGVAPDLVRRTLQQAQATEYERARDLWQRRFGAAPADAQERARQMRFLAGRGFDAEIVRRVVKGPSPGDDDG